MQLYALTKIARSKGDPEVQRSGPSSLTNADRLARALGWFSIGLGLAEVLAADRIARSLGLDDKKGLIRGYGVRELASGMMTLSPDKAVGLKSRIGGDLLDLATLISALSRYNPRRSNAATALALVTGVTLLDLVAYCAVKATHQRALGGKRDYSDRSGLPKGPKASRGLARKDFQTPSDYRAEGSVASELPAVNS